MARLGVRNRWIWFPIVVLGFAPLALLGPAGAVASAPAPDGPAVVNDVAYGGPGQRELVLDVYRPASKPTAAPVVILVHGGGWTAGDKADFRPESQALARGGFVVFTINYSLDPSLGPAYPRQVNDVQTALRWIEENAPEYGGDPGRIAIVGGSAGAHLAAMVGLQGPVGEGRPIRAVASLSGPMDLTAIVDQLRQVVRQSDGTCAPVPCSVVDQASTDLRALLGCEPMDCPVDLLRAASPASYVTAESPPFFLANATDENVPPSQATTMAALLRAQNVPVEVQLVRGEEHSAQYLDLVANSLLTFLRKHLGSPDSTSTPSTTPAPSVRGTEPVGAVATPNRRVRWLLAGAVVVSALVLLARVRRAGSRPSRSPDLR